MINSFIDKSLKPDRGAIVDDYNNSKDKDYFRPSGIQMFTGLQGQGKTYSMVRAMLKIKKRYPKCKIVTNLNLTVDFDFIKFSTLEELSSVLTGVNNGKFGVLYVIDEIQNYFNALESKNIPIWVFTEISQQRKQRKCILGTSQLFLRVAKPFREQVDSLIMCRCYGGIFCVNQVLNGSTITEDFGEVIGDCVRIGFFFQSRKVRNSYDTYQVVFRGSSKLEYASAASPAGYSSKNHKKNPFI